MIASDGSEIVESEIRLLQGGENAGKKHVGVVCCGGLSRLIDQLIELLFHAAETVVPELERIEVGFEIESRDFGGESRVVCTLQYLQRNRSGSQVAVDQEHLLLRSDARDSTLESSILEHECQRAEIFQQCLHEGMRFFLIDVWFDLVLSHFGSLCYTAFA